jgi:hypothetical protein
MSFSGNVLGGVGYPRFYLLSEDMVSNGSMEDDDNSDNLPDGWTAGGAGSINRVADTSTIFGDYVMNLIDASVGANGWAQSSVMDLPSGEDINGHELLVSMWVKLITGTPNPGGLIVYVYNSSNILVGNEEVVAIIGTTWQQLWIPVRPLVSLTGDTDLYITILPTRGGVSELANYYVDNVQVFEVNDTVDISVEPQEYQAQGWDKQLQTGRQTLIDGSLKEYVHGWRYRCEIGYDLLTAADEVLRQSIADHDGLIGFMPHIDTAWGQICLWNGALDRTYWLNRFLGHTSAIPLIGAELMNEKPTGT